MAACRQDTSNIHLALLPLFHVRESDEQGGLQLDASGQERTGPKSNLNNISGCGFRSILDLCYPLPQARFSVCVCVLVFVGGGDGIDLAGPQTMWIPQGVVRGWLEHMEGPATSVSPHPSLRLK